MTNFWQRMVGAAKLDLPIYEEVESDRSATGQAMAVVVFSSVAAGIGSLRLGISGLAAATIAALISWFIWALLAFFIGTKLLPEPQTRSDIGELLRTTGFSSSPGILRILTVVPLAGGIINLVVSIWLLVAMVIAVRQALDYRSTLRAVGVCLVGWIIYVAVFLALARTLGVRGLAG